MKIKITPDKERAKSMLELIKHREVALESLKKGNSHATIIAENYYEIIKELFTAIVLIDGFKFVKDNSHKALINYVKKYSEFEEFELELVQDLRIRRNKSSYEGKPIEDIYLENKSEFLGKIIKKSKEILKEKLYV